MSKVVNGCVGLTLRLRLLFPHSQTLPWCSIWGSYPQFAPQRFPHLRTHLIVALSWLTGSAGGASSSSSPPPPPLPAPCPLSLHLWVAPLLPMRHPVPFGTRGSDLVRGARCASCWSTDRRLPFKLWRCDSLQCDELQACIGYIRCRPGMSRALRACREPWKECEDNCLQKGDMPTRVSWGQI